MNEFAIAYEDRFTSSSAWPLTSFAQLQSSAAVRADFSRCGQALAGAGDQGHAAIESQSHHPVLFQWAPRLPTTASSDSAALPPFCIGNARV
jgi:hypothetical protein